MAREINASYEERNQRSPKDLIRMKQQVKEMEEAISALKTGLTNIKKSLGTVVSKTFSLNVSAQSLWVDSGQTFTLPAGQWILITSIIDRGYTTPGIWIHNIANIGGTVTYWKCDGNYSPVQSASFAWIGEQRSGTLNYFCSYCGLPRTVEATIFAVRII